MDDKPWTADDEEMFRTAMDKIDVAFGVEPRTVPLGKETEAWLASKRAASPPRRSGLLGLTKH